MIEFNKIQLKPSSVLGIPIKTYDNDFTFIINGEEFKTSRIISDLLSPKICNIHFSDPTSNVYIINTSHKGNFSRFLNLATFDEIDIPENEQCFISEVIEKLGLEYIKVTTIDSSTNLTIDNVFPMIQKHEKFERIYSKLFSEEIDFISEHFYEICETKEEELKQLSIGTLFRIINNQKLKLNSEDQLLHFLNEIYGLNSNYSILYECVQFVNVTTDVMKEFLSVFDSEFISRGTWLALSCRLENEITKENKNESANRYNNQKQQPKNEGMTFVAPSDNSFSGILNFLRKKSNKNIESEVEITGSSVLDSSDRHQPRNVVDYENQSNEFYTKDQPDNWICFDFKEHRIIPTDYTIKSYDCIQNYRSAKSWKLEVSNDNNSWEVIDEVENCEEVNGNCKVHTFRIKQQPSNAVRYLRMKSTGKCWNGQNHFNIGKFEIYGALL